MEMFLRSQNLYTCDYVMFPFFPFCVCFKTVMTTITTWNWSWLEMFVCGSSHNILSTRDHLFAIKNFMVMTPKFAWVSCQSQSLEHIELKKHWLSPRTPHIQNQTHHVSIQNVFLSSVSVYLCIKHPLCHILPHDAFTKH